MDKNLVILSKLISYALRHEPWVFELELDEHGWVEVAELIAALKIYQPNLEEIDRAHIQTIIDQSPKTRFEMNEYKIRAIYGHSLPGKLLKEPSKPPEILYHGTTIETAKLIQEEGIKPMVRQYVHLSVDIGFYLGNDKVWLSDLIPPNYIDFN